MIYPLTQEIPYQAPAIIFSIFAELSGSVLLESAQMMAGCGKYSFIAVDPFLILTSKNNEIICGEEKLIGENIFAILAEQLARFPLSTHANFPPFQGGVAGFFSYDLYQHLEKIVSSQIDDMQFPDLVLGFYDVVIGFDHELKRAWIFSSGYPLKNKFERELRAKERCEALRLKIETGLFPISSQTNEIIKVKDIQANFSSEQYQTAVEKVKEYILAGDIFEANISQRFHVNLPENFIEFNLYKLLCEINPAPFAAYLKFSEIIIVSASPERFLKLVNQQVETRPIKGTRKRGKNSEEDSKLAQGLLNSEKDHAENIMIVDLLRNDLSRVCEDHTVEVPQLCRLESYATVHHLVSVVTGKLQKKLGAVDLLRATFPGGSITGAPKIRAMEIIAEIEPTVRGPYCGSIGYIGFNGDMDSSITIRTFAIKNNNLTFQAGGAVVADSDALSEYEETLTKASALRRALTNII